MCVNAAERTATASRLAATLLDCIKLGSRKTPPQPPKGSRSKPASSSTPQSAAAADEQHQVIIVGCVESAEDTPSSLRRCFTHEMRIEAPDASERRQLLQVCISKRPPSLLPPVLSSLLTECICSCQTLIAESQTASALVPQVLPMCSISFCLCHSKILQALSGQARKQCSSASTTLQ